MVQSTERPSRVWPDTLRTTASLLYERERVMELVCRLSYRRADVERMVPGGIFVLRRFVDIRWPWARQVDAVSGSWQLGLWLPGAQQLYLDADPRGVPAVVTVAGFVAQGFTVSGIATDHQSPGRHRFLLAEPGEWFSQLREAHIESGPGSPWHFWHPYRS